MSRAYPRFFIELLGEPGDVRAVADTLADRARNIDEASFDAIAIPVSYLGGPTFERARSATLDLANLTSTIADSLRDSAEKLRDWADTIEEYRGELDRMHPEQDQLYKELAVDEPRLNFLRAKGKLSDEEQVEFSYLWGKVGDLKRSISANHKWAQGKLEEYEDKAEEVGSSLRSDSVSSPAASAGDRRARTFLGFSSDLATLIDAGGWLSLALGGIGAVPGKLGSKATREILDRINDGLQKSLIAGATAKLGSDGVAATSGAGVSPGELVFDTLNLKGIGPLDRLKADAIERLDSELGERVTDRVIEKAEDRLKGAVFGDREVTDPSLPPEFQWQGTRGREVFDA